LTGTNNIVYFAQPPVTKKMFDEMDTNDMYSIFLALSGPPQSAPIYGMLLNSLTNIRLAREACKGETF
jgi:hypothetical protein